MIRRRDGVVLSDDARVWGYRCCSSALDLAGDLYSCPDCGSVHPHEIVRYRQRVLVQQMAERAWSHAVVD